MRITPILIVAFLILSVTACQTNVGDAPLKAAAEMKSAAPELSLRKLENGRVGEPVKLSSLRGKPVVLNFWATWCEPCKQELPLFDEAFRKYRNSRDLQVIGVNVQDHATGQAIQQYLADAGILYPVWLDEGGVANQTYKVQALPTTFFIDRSGVIQQIRIGGPISQEFLEEQLQKIW